MQGREFELETQIDTLLARATRPNVAEANESDLLDCVTASPSNADDFDARMRARRDSS